MVWRLDDVVCSGEIINTRNNSVHGYLSLRDADQPVLLQLTGNCGPELAGRHLRFEVREGTLPESYEFDADRFAMQQIGPTGRMTLDQTAGNGDAKSANGSSLAPRRNPGAAVPHLHLEWFSQNGRVILDLVDPVIEFVEGDTPQLYDELDDEDSQDSVGGLEDLSWGDDDSDFLDDDSSEADEDPYGLFPEELRSQLDQDAADVDAAIEMDGDDETREIWEKWDEMFSGEKDEPICTLFDPPLKLFPAERLDDDQIARALDLLLARLALHGISLDMCEHYTPREAYQLLTEQILREENVYPDIPSTGFVYHYMTSEYCEQCDAELATRYEEYEERSAEEGIPSEDEASDDGEEYF